MLVRFDSKAGGGFSMYEEDARQMLKLMGHSGTIPSAIQGADVPQALKTFEASLAAAVTEQKKIEAEQGQEEHKDEDHVTVDRRAYPMHEMLKLAAAKQADILWYEDNSPLL